MCQNKTQLQELQFCPIHTEQKTPELPQRIPAFGGNVQPTRVRVGPPRVAAMTEFALSGTLASASMAFRFSLGALLW